MTSITRESVRRRAHRTAPILRAWWARTGPILLPLAVALMCGAALYRLWYESFGLVWDSAEHHARDLRYYHEWAHRWFSGETVHAGPDGAEYPPASFALLWPLVGWLELTPARWLWAVTTVAALVWLSWLLVRGSGASTPKERAFVALILLSMSPTHTAIGTGQLIVHVLPLLVGAMLLLNRVGRGWAQELTAAALFLMALVKPTISAPFFWLVLFAPRGLRPAALITLGYAVLTVFAAAFQPTGLLLLIRDSLAYASTQAATGGYANLHIWLAAFGLEGWIVPTSLLTLAAFGLWAYRYRNVDVWLRLGVAALVARVWTYHRQYDDVLILLPIVALFRIAKHGSSESSAGVVAGGLLAISALLVFIPVGLLYASPTDLLYEGAHVLFWLVLLIFLLERASSQRSSISP